MDATPTSVYRYYDKHDILIYVGITSRGVERNREHNTLAPWWTYVCRQEVEHYSTREEASAREVELIRQFRPPFNVKHNHDPHGLRAAYLAWISTEPADADPMELWRQLDRNLLLTPVSQTIGEGLVLRTDPAHYAVVKRINFEHKPLLTFGKKARIHGVCLIGASALIDIRAPRASWIGRARAKVALDMKRDTGPMFRINQIQGLVELASESRGPA